MKTTERRVVEAATAYVRLRMAVIPQSLAHSIQHARLVDEAFKELKEAVRGLEKENAGS